jgi:2,6-dihydroxypyridine 3-monooxygenase
MSGPRVIVMGGSLGGLNAALWLRDAGCDVEVYERSEIPLAGLGAGIVLNPATVRYFTANGVLDLDEISVPAGWLRYMDQEGGIVDEQPVSYLFSSYTALYRRFMDCFGKEHYHLNTPIEKFEQDADGVVVRLAEGCTKRCELLVCADGIRSTAREQLIRDATLEYAGYVAWRGTVSEDEVDPETYALLDEAIIYHVMPYSHMLAYPIPMVDGTSGSGRPQINWLWYCNVAEGRDLDDLMTDREGTRRAVSLYPGIVQSRHIEKLREDAKSALPPPLVEVTLETAEPFVQTVFDAEVPRMAFGRVALIGDAAFAARPHAAAGSAKAAEDAFKLSEAVKKADGNVPAALKNWESSQLNLGRNVLFRTRKAGRRSQFEGTWRVGDPLPFGLYEVGDSEMSGRTVP